MDPVVLRAKLKRNLPLIFSLNLLLIGLAVGMFLIGQTQIFKKQAAGICPVEGAVCQWDYSQDSIGSTTFNYQIIDLTTGETVKSGTTQATRITFTPLVDHQYSCKVTPSSTCGHGPERVALNTCTSTPQPSATPTPPVTPSSTPLPTVTGTPGPSPTPSATGTPRPSLTPTVTGTPGSSPTPSATGTPEPSPTVTPIHGPSPSFTPTPTMEGPVPTTKEPTPTQAVGAPAPSITPTPLAENLPESAAIEPTLYLLILGMLLIVLGGKLLF